MEAVASGDNPLRSSSTTAKIDTHAHFLPDFYAQALRDAGHLPGPDGMPGIPEWSPEAHLEFMDAQGIEKSYLSVSSPGVYLSVPSRPATDKAVSLARRVNEYASGVKAAHPDRFGFFASLPLPDVAAAIDEIAHCFARLDPRPDGVVLLSNAYGLYFGDPAMDPVWAALDALNATVFQHPTAPCTEHNHQAYRFDADVDPGIAPSEWAALNRPVAARQGRAPTLDFPFETARTFADLFYSTVPARFPAIEWIMPHAGGGLVPTLDRLVGFSAPELNLTEASMKATLARSFFFDLAGPWPVTSAIPALLRWVGHDKIVWGSDVPFTPWATAALGAARFDKDVDDVFNGTDDAQDVRRCNAARLFE
ncbi:amidohydrolase [Colletotrichum cereale]|nr:amidohydrolase [Colletotrichum cereale]